MSARDSSQCKGTYCDTFVDTCITEHTSTIAINNQQRTVRNAATHHVTQKHFPLTAVPRP